MTDEKTTHKNLFQVDDGLVAAIRLTRTRTGLVQAVKDLDTYLEEGIELPAAEGKIAAYVLDSVEVALSGGMTDEKIVSAFRACEERLRGGFMILDGCDVVFTPTQDEYPGNRALWCAVEGPKLVAEGRREKAMRWLGFVQGVTFTLGLATVDQIKNDSKPDESEEG